VNTSVKTLVKCTLTLCALFTVAFAQTKPKAAVYIMGNPEGRDAIKAAINTFLIKSGKYQMVAVDAIDIVAQEQQRQMSGTVSDGDIASLGRDAGAQYVCVVQRSELDGISYVATRMVSVQSKVAELADIVELPPGGKVIDIIQWQIGSMLGMPVGPRPSSPTGSGSGYAARPAQSATAPAQTAAASADKTDPPVQGTLVPGGSLVQKLAWLQKSADSHETYIIEVAADESIAPNNTLEYKGAINITIVMRGVGGNRTLKLSSHGTMFIVRKEVTFVLENNITLRGHSGNTGRMINVEEGKLKIKTGAAITGNEGGGISGNGTIEMSGGTISGNGRRTNLDGGGIALGGGTFTMNGGTISGNIATKGGGVYLNSGEFSMNGGTISGNTATKGGGMYLYGGAITLRNGNVLSNIAIEYGGGVCVESRGWFTGSFTKTGGTVTGYKNDKDNGNIVKDEEGGILARRGHAIYRNENQRKETTAGTGANFAADGSGPWDQ